jgi:hypothetical protein
MRPNPLVLALLLLPAAASADPMPQPLARALVRDLEEMLEPPAKMHGGTHRVMLESVELGSFDEKHLVAHVRLRYQKTKGFPKYSTSGLVHARFRVYPGTNGEICLADLAVDKVDLNRVPDWLDGPWVTKWLSGKLPGEVCAK